MARALRTTSSSFTERVLAEVAPHVPPLACCRAALVEGAMLAQRSAPRSGVLVSTSRAVAARAVLQVLHALRLEARVQRVTAARRHRWEIIGDPPRSLVSRRLCCRRSLLRGAFLAGGLVSRPGAAPHAEIVAAGPLEAARIAAAASALTLQTSVVDRRGVAWVTVRTAPAVAGLLSSIGAQKARLDFEEGRVEAEVRATVNRRINAETANLRRTVNAAVVQAAAADMVLRSPLAWASLPPALHEAARLRHDHPADSLAVLAGRAGLSRGAMAGRLHRLVDAVARGPGPPPPRRRRSP